MADFTFVSAGTEVNSTTTSIDVPYPATGVAAGNVAMIVVGAKWDVASVAPSFTDPSTWALEIVAHAVASAAITPAVDAGPATAAAWTKELTGSESGTVSVGVAGADVAVGIMLIWSNDGSNWEVVAVGGDEATTTTSNFDPTWDSALAVADDDLVLYLQALNTDSGGAFTSASYTQTGATVVYNAARASANTTAGLDTAVHCYEFEVTAGSSSATPTVAVVRGGSAKYGGAALLALRNVSGDVNLSGTPAHVTVGGPAGTLDIQAGGAVNLGGTPGHVQTGGPTGSLTGTATPVNVSGTPGHLGVGGPAGELEVETVLDLGGPAGIQLGGPAGTLTIQTATTLTGSPGHVQLSGPAGRVVVDVIVTGRPASTQAGGPSGVLDIAVPGPVNVTGRPTSIQLGGPAGSLLTGAPVVRGLSSDHARPNTFASGAARQRFTSGPARRPTTGG